MGDTRRVCEPASPLLAPGLQVETMKPPQGKGLAPTSRKNCKYWSWQSNLLFNFGEKKIRAVICAY